MYSCSSKPQKHKKKERLGQQTVRGGKSKTRQRVDAMQFPLLSFVGAAAVQKCNIDITASGEWVAVHKGVVSGALQKI